MLSRIRVFLHCHRRIGTIYSCSINIHSIRWGWILCARMCSISYGIINEKEKVRRSNTSKEGQSRSQLIFLESPAMLFKSIHVSLINVSYPTVQYIVVYTAYMFTWETGFHLNHKTNSKYSCNSEAFAGSSFHSSERKLHRKYPIYNLTWMVTYIEV